MRPHVNDNGKRQFNDGMAERHDGVVLYGEDADLLVVLRATVSALEIAKRVDPGLLRRSRSLRAFVEAGEAVADEFGFGGA